MRVHLRGDTLVLVLHQEAGDGAEQEVAPPAEALEVGAPVRRGAEARGGGGVWLEGTRAKLARCSSFAGAQAILAEAVLAPRERHGVRERAEFARLGMAVRGATPLRVEDYATHEARALARAWLALPSGIDAVKGAIG